VLELGLLRQMYDLPPRGILGGYSSGFLLLSLLSLLLLFDCRSVSVSSARRTVVFSLTLVCQGRLEPTGPGWVGSSTVVWWLLSLVAVGLSQGEP
jgi:hypothetical protein